MDIYNILIASPCEECEEKIAHRVSCLSQKVYEMSRNCDAPDKCQYDNYLPSVLFGTNRHYASFITPQTALGSDENTELLNQDFNNCWLDLTTITESDFNGIIKEYMTCICTENLNTGARYTENMAENLHEISDKLPTHDGKVDVYWIICKHVEYLDISTNIAIYGALKRLQLWYNATIRWVVGDDIEPRSEILMAWKDVLGISIQNLEHMKSDNNQIVWQGSLIDFDNESIFKAFESNWQLVYVNRFDSRDSTATRNDYVLADEISILQEVRCNEIPIWHLLPYKFVLYHNSVEDKILGKNPEPEYEREMAPFFLACVQKTQPIKRGRKTTREDWIRFVENDLVHESRTTDHCLNNPSNTLYLVLRGTSLRGAFIVYFLRAPQIIHRVHSLVTIYEASCKNTKTRVLDSVDIDACAEKQWLKLLDKKPSFVSSPLKSQFSLAVHLDASEMLKHFTKDGKPLKKELESLKEQIERKRRTSSEEQDGGAKTENTSVGIDYCTDDKILPNRTYSPKLLPKHVKHETLSICNTPKTLAKAKLQGAKRKTISECEAVNDEPTTSKNNEQSIKNTSKKARLSASTATILTKPTNKKGNIPGQTTDDKNNDDVKTKEQRKTKKSKRKSFDGTEESLTTIGNSSETDSKEKRSERHKRRLARVVKRALIKYGVEPTEKYFETCSERLYYLCKSFLKDLKTSEGLNNEMKRLADSNVANVVEFEKRKRATEQAKNKT